MTSIYADRRTQDSINLPRRCKIPLRQPGFPSSRNKSLSLVHTRLGKNFETVKTRPKSEKLMNVKDGVVSRDKSVDQKDNSSKQDASMIVVPVSQELIRVSADSELFNNNLDITKVLQQIMDRADQSIPNDLCELRKYWEDKLNRYLNLKKDLDKQQGTILHLLASVIKTHEKLKKLGENPQLPPTDLRILNTSNYQLLHLSSYESPSDNDTLESIDFDRLYETPTKMVMACDQLLVKRQEIVDYFDQLREQHGISMSKYSKKIYEFNAETRMLSSSVNTIKSEFMLKLNEIVEYLRTGQNRTTALQLRSEALTNEISKLNSQNAELRRQIHTARLSKVQHNKRLHEEDEKDKKGKMAILKERLSRAEVELKNAVENASQLKMALEQARSHNWNLERSIQQLNEQNSKLQYEFDSELSKLTTSIKENSLHLEQIAEARKKLLTEKEDLEKRLLELSDSYNESMENKKEEINVTVAKLLEAESKYENEVEKNAKLRQDHETIYIEVLAAELRHKETLKTLDERQAEIMAKETELEDLSKQLELINQELEDSRKSLAERNETITEIEHKLKEVKAVEKDMRSDIADKEEYIAELEKKNALLENQLQENENKMESYELQVKTLAKEIEQLNDAEKIENELREILEKQSKTLQKVVQEKELLIQEKEYCDEANEELTQENERLIQEKGQLIQEKEQMIREKEQMNREKELLEQDKEQLKQEKEQLFDTLKKKETLTEQHLEKLIQQQNTLLKSSVILKMQENQEEEKADIIHRMQKHFQVGRNTAERDAEIESLEVSLDNRIDNIVELKKIIHALEEQLRKLNIEKQRDQGKIIKLEKTLSEYESYVDARCSTNNSVHNLNSLIKLLEEELGALNETTLGNDVYKSINQKYTKEFNPDNENIKYPAGCDTVPTKIAMRNYAKRTTNMGTKDEEPQRGERVDRKRAISELDALKQMSSLDQGPRAAGVAHSVKVSLPRVTLAPVQPPTSETRTMLIKNIQYLTTNQHKAEKKIRMYQLAGHRL